MDKANYNVVDRLSPGNLCWANRVNIDNQQEHEGYYATGYQSKLLVAKPDWHSKNKSG
jgi:hypothetical protein